MLNAVWIALIASAFVFGALAGRLDAVAAASTEAAKKAVELVIGLVGVMAFWLGLMRVLQRAGLVHRLTIWGRPVLRRLFPGVPADHPALGMILMNMSANLLGLGNAATPFGLKAMIELDRLNPKRGVATDAMALLLAINTSHIALLPTGMIALRSSLGSASPGAIIVTTLAATTLSTLTAIAMAKLLAPLFPPGEAEADAGDGAAPPNLDLPAVEAFTPPAKPARAVRAIILLTAAASMAALVYALVEVDAGGPLAALNVGLTQWTLVVLILGIVLYGAYHGVQVFDCVVEGAQETFQIAVKLVPYFIALIVAIGMFRASGAIDRVVGAVAPLTARIGFPAEALPMALIRPLSGKGAFAIAAETMEAHGPDSFVGMVVSTMQGSTDTTFYVVALYFGVVAVKRVRHTILACLTADVVGALAAAWMCHLLLSR